MHLSYLSLSFQIKFPILLLSLVHVTFLPIMQHVFCVACYWWMPGALALLIG